MFVILRRSRRTCVSSRPVQASSNPSSLGPSFPCLSPTFDGDNPYPRPVTVLVSPDGHLRHPAWRNSPGSPEDVCVSTRVRDPPSAIQGGFHCRLSQCH